MKKIVPISLLVYMLCIMFYTLFMNEKTVYRDLFFFTLIFGNGALLSFIFNITYIH